MSPKKKSCDVKIPIPCNVEISALSDAVLVEWDREGMVDGFIIFIGTDNDHLEEYKRIAKGFKTSYFERITDIEKNKEYYLSIAAYKGNAVSKMSDIVKVIFGTLQNDHSDNVRAHDRKRSEADDTKKISEASITSCGICNADVVLDNEEQVFKCRSCEEIYVQRVGDGKFVSINILENGICRCCNPKRPLIHPRGEAYKICSNSGEKYADVEGNILRLSELDYGFCTCCNPPIPLMLNHQGQVVCSRKKDHLYVEENGRYVYIKPEMPGASVDDIDRALANGTAIMGPNGIISDNNNR